ncbi:2-C-methyl-D-erythritol 4-phosphate cytidylyltransferase [Eubacterium ruminantium]|uniref:2-C-methyl-D-erythritol 4-phosphate cytidylyltransferase n=1 Tax=Eubacterium ruminantium TaxID=42322 RepID=UPI0015694C13|nr:2-C-methyl-D-erythritol 4-phosphate cytidylyltransferase [Eubacterium ruminantium]
MVSVIVLAAGSGSRMKSSKAKQFMEIGGKPLIYHALKVFEASIVDEIILVTRQQDINFMREEVVKKYSFNKVKKIVAGGKERYDSVENGIKACDKRNNIIMIHDGARPFVTNAMILSSISEVKRCKACTVAVPVKDTIKVVDEEGYGIDTPDRSTLYQIQTPQTFDRKIITEAYSRMRSDKNRNITDDTMLVERYLDQKVKVVEGSYNNIKITTPEDIALAEAILGV